MHCLLRLQAGAQVLPSLDSAAAEAEHSPAIKMTKKCSCSSPNQKLVFGNKQRFVILSQLLTSDRFKAN